MKNSLMVSPLAERQTAIVAWLNKLPLKGTELGVSRRYFEKNALELCLSIEEMDTLMHVRAQFGAGVGAVFKLISKGEDMDQVCQAYRARSEVQDILYRQGVSISAVLRLLKTFPELEDHDELSSQIVQVRDDLRRKMPWVKNVDTAVRIVCEAAEYYCDSDLWAVVTMVIKGVRVPRS